MNTDFNKLKADMEEIMNDAYYGYKERPGRIK